MTTNQTTGRGAAQVAADKLVIVRSATGYAVKVKGTSEVKFQGSWTECVEYFDANV